MPNLQDKLLELANGFIGRFLLTQGMWDLNCGTVGPRKKVRDALMDQHVLCSGVGNYLLCEVLYETKIHPDALFSKLSAAERAELFFALQRIVRGHYDGSRSKLIYKQKVAPCGSKIKTEKFGQRTCHWVPEVQTKGI